MRISDDERREVAANMRSAAERAKDDLNDDSNYSKLAVLYVVSCGVRGVPRYKDLLHLADLIDRPIANEMRECNDIEERRKIANRLRGLDSKIGDRDTLSTAVDELRMAVCGNAAISPVECSVRNLVGFALELADLIEGNQYGGTCRNVYPNNEDHHCDNGFRCSACGDTVEDCENYRVSGTWNYCPKCRAKVVG